MRKSVKRILTQENLKRILSYDPITGIFTRIGCPSVKPTRNELIGSEAGCVGKNGYVTIWVEGSHYLAHRLAFLYMEGSFPEKSTDHIDGCPTNNAWINLRRCDQSQNGANQGKRVQNTSGRKGVTWCAMTGKWRAKITFRGKCLHVGRFADVDAAGKAYQAAADQLFAEFARRVV